MLLADYQSYIDCRCRVSAFWHTPDSWTSKSIINVARMGKFSSDRPIRDCCDQVWHVKPIA
jgi:starch phosphorylase